MLDKNRVIKDLKREEGFMPHAYQDQLGFWTIGYGTLIDKRKGGGITEYIAGLMMEEDVNACIDALFKAIPWLRTMPDDVQNALIQMAYQMGVGDAKKGLLSFKNTLPVLQAGDFHKAADMFLQSTWARQTPARAKRVTDMIRNAV